MTRSVYRSSIGGANDVSPRAAPIHTALWRMWISSFSHALRLTIAVEKALTTSRSLDTPPTIPSLPKSAFKQGFRAVVVRGSPGRGVPQACDPGRDLPVVAEPSMKPGFPQVPQIGHVCAIQPGCFPHILNSLWINPSFLLQNNVSSPANGRFCAGGSHCYTRRPAPMSVLDRLLADDRACGISSPLGGC